MFNLKFESSLSCPYLKRRSKMPTYYAYLPYSYDAIESNLIEHLKGLMKQVLIRPTCTIVHLHVHVSGLGNMLVSVFLSL